MPNRVVVAEPEIESLGELMFEATGAITIYEVTSDDPRLAGTATLTGEWTGAYPPSLVTVLDTNWLIDDGVGQWSGSSRRLSSMADEDPINGDEQLILDASGAYEGLTAYLIVDDMGETFIGVIIPDEMPELPPDWMDIYQADAEETGID